MISLLSNNSNKQQTNQERDIDSSFYTNLNPNLSQVSFRVKYETEYGQSVFIVGNIEELGSWDPSKAIPLTTTPENYPIWKSTTDLICPVGMEIDYKYLVKQNQNYHWEVIAGSKSQNRHIIINTPGNFIICDEKGSIISQVKSINNNIMSPLNFTNNSGVIGNNNNRVSSTPTISSFQKDILSIDLSESKFSDGDIQEIVSYENNQLSSIDGTNNELCFLNRTPQLTSDDRIIIASALLPFEVDKVDNPSGNDKSKYVIKSTDDKLIYLILFGMKEKKFCEVIWVGMLKNAYKYTEDELNEIYEFLKQHNVYMVNVPDNDYKNFWIYINQIISPIFVQSAIDIRNEYFLNHEKYFTSYQNVNRIFGDMIHNIMTESDLVMINDISLALIPNFVMQKNANSKIGIYFHICIPSSEVLRAFPYHSEIMKSVLLCDVIGFHIFRYARNFLMALNQEFGINYEVKLKGNLVFSYLGRDVLIHIRHAGIDLDYIASLTRTKGYLSALEKFSNITKNKFTLISIDNPLEVNQLSIKLEAYKCYLKKYPEMKDKIVLIQIITYDKTNKEKKISSNIEKITNEIIQENGEGCIHLQLIENIPVWEQLALFSLGNILMIMQMWNGLCTLANQFISLQSEQKIYGLIVNESVGISPTIKSAIRVNSFNKNDIVRAIETMYTMPEIERKKNFEHDMHYIKENSTFNWIQSFFVNLKKMTSSQSLSSKIGLGMGLNFRLMKLNSNFTHLNFNTLLNAYTRSNFRFFFLDYENTLQNTEDENEISPSSTSVKPNKKLINLLSNLTKDERNQVYIVTNRQKEYLTDMFKEVDNIGFGAEYGFFYKIPNEKNYQQFETLFPLKDWSWKETVMKILQSFKAKTEGSFIVKKEATIAWYYKECDSYFGHLQANELTSHLNNIFEGGKIDVVNGKDCVEIKPKNVNKGYFISHIIQKEFLNGKTPDFVLAIGDDEGDEEMFKYLTSVESQLRRIGKDITTFGVTVGKKPSTAKYYLNEVNEIILYLDSLSHKTQKISK